MSAIAHAAKHVAGASPRQHVVAKYLEAVIRLADVYGFSPREVAATLSVDTSTVHRWEHGLTSPSADGERSLKHVADCVSELDDAFEDASADAYTWLRNPLRGLGSKRPIDVMTNGQVTRVTSSLGRINHGDPA